MERSDSLELRPLVISDRRAAASNSVPRPRGPLGAASRTSLGTVGASGVGSGCLRDAGWGGKKGVNLELSWGSQRPIATSNWERPGRERATLGRRAALETAARDSGIERPPQAWRHCGSRGGSGVDTVMDCPVPGSRGHPTAAAAAATERTVSSWPDPFLRTAPTPRGRTLSLGPPPRSRPLRGSAALAVPRLSPGDRLPNPALPEPLASAGSEGGGGGSLGSLSPARRGSLP